MSRQLPPCPHLPPAPPCMDASVLTAHGNERDAEFYLTALTYAQYLWQRGLAARAILKLDRALLSDVRGHEAELRQWPLPYEAMAWLLRHAPPNVFIGNPRVHFQHLADRMKSPAANSAAGAPGPAGRSAAPCVRNFPPTPNTRSPSRASP